MKNPKKPFYFFQCFHKKCVCAKLAIIYLIVFSFISCTQKNIPINKSATPIKKISKIKYINKIKISEYNLYKLYYNFANFLFKKKDIDKAEEILEKAVMLHVNDTKALIALINIYKQKQYDRDSVIKISDRIIASKSANINTLIFLSFLCYDNKYEEKASKMFYLIGEKYPLNSSVPYIIASYAIALDEKKINLEGHKKLVFALDNFLYAAPNNNAAHYIAGESYQILNSYDLSEKHFKRVSDKAGEYNVATLKLSHIYKLKGEYEKAITHLKNAIKKDPKNFRFNIELVSVYYKKKTNR